MFPADKTKAIRECRQWDKYGSMEDQGKKSLNKSINFERRPSLSHGLPFHFFQISLAPKSMYCIGYQHDLKINGYKWTKLFCSCGFLNWWSSKALAVGYLKKINGHRHKQHIAIQALKPSSFTLIQNNNNKAFKSHTNSKEQINSGVYNLHSACLHDKYSHTIFNFG